MRARSGGSAEQVLTLLPGEPEQRSTRRLKRLAAIGEPGNGLGGERDTRRTTAGDDPALGVPRDQARELRVEQVGVEDRDGEQVRGERQRVHAQAEAAHGEPALAHGAGQPAVERPAVVVEQPAAGRVVLRGAEKLLAELPGHGLPQAQVVPQGRGRAGDRLEQADGHHLVQPATVVDLGGIPPVQHERRAPGRRPARARPRGRGRSPRSSWSPPPAAPPERSAGRPAAGSRAGSRTAPAGPAPPPRRYSSRTVPPPPAAAAPPAKLPRNAPAPPRPGSPDHRPTRAPAHRGSPVPPAPTPPGTAGPLPRRAAPPGTGVPPPAPAHAGSPSAPRAQPASSQQTCRPRQPCPPFPWHPSRSTPTTRPP